MTLVSAIFTSIEISKIMVPPIFLGFFLAGFIRSSKYFRYLAYPTARLASLSHLQPGCSGSLTMFLVNSWAALAMLSEDHRAKRINDRELLVAVLIGYIPKGLNNALLYSIPVALSVLGMQAGGIYIILDFMVSFLVALAGIIIGRSVLIARPTDEDPSGHVTARAPLESIRTCLIESIRSSMKVIWVLIPTIFLAQLAMDHVLMLPIVETYDLLIRPLGLTSSSLIVLIPAVVSQSASLVASGTLLREGAISVKSCLILLFMARFIHMGIGFFRIGIPAEVSYFGGSLGLRIAAIEYLLIELLNAAMIAGVLFFVFPH